jgi:hypothetical protein
MNFNEFKDSLNNDVPPGDISNLLKALWYDGKDNWEQAHNIVQDMHNKEASWIHAYLHRKEGDDGNASYWYNRAGKRMADGSFTEEWEGIVKALL